MDARYASHAPRGTMVLAAFEGHLSGTSPSQRLSVLELALMRGRPPFLCVHSQKLGIAGLPVVKLYSGQNRPSSPIPSVSLHCEV